MVFLWGLSDSKSPQVFWILLSTLSDISNAVVWMVLGRTLISNSSFPLKKLWGDRFNIIIIIIYSFRVFYISIS